MLSQKKRDDLENASIGLLFFSRIEEIVVLNHGLMSAIYHGEPRAIWL